VRHATAEPLTDDQMEKMRAINEALVERTEKFESNTQYNDALEVLRKAEKTILPKVTDEMEKMQLEQLARQLRQAMAGGDLAAMQQFTTQLSDRLLNLAYLL
jgi:hypothetical protein